MKDSLYFKMAIFSFFAANLLLISNSVNRKRKRRHK